MKKSYFNLLTKTRETFSLPDLPSKNIALSREGVLSVYIEISYGILILPYTTFVSLYKDYIRYIIYTSPQKIDGIYQQFKYMPESKQWYFGNRGRFILTNEADVRNIKKEPVRIQMNPLFKKYITELYEKEYEKESETRVTHEQDEETINCCSNY